MFNPTLFADVNKAAYDVLKDGYCLDSKMCLKTSTYGNKVTLEGKSISDSVVGKLTMDMKLRKYVQKKKLSIDSAGVFTSETDIGNILNNTTFMLRNQRDFANRKALKRGVGLKYLNNTCATEFMYDFASKSYSASITHIRGAMLVGCRLSGNITQHLSSIDPCICYKFSDATFSLSSSDFFTILHGALYATPFTNVQIAAIADLPVEGAVPEISFGFCMKPQKNVETRMKVDNKGIMSVCYKTLVGEKMLFTMTASTPMDLTKASQSRFGFSMEMVLFCVCYSRSIDVAEVLKRTGGMFEEVIGKLSSETTMGMPIIIIS